MSTRNKNIDVVFLIFGVVLLIWDSLLVIYHIMHGNTGLVILVAIAIWFPVNIITRAWRGLTS